MYFSNCTLSVHSRVLYCVPISKTCGKFAENANRGQIGIYLASSKSLSMDPHLEVNMTMDTCQHGHVKLGIWG